MRDIKMYERLRHTLGEEQTQDLIAFIKSEVNSEFMDCKEVFLTKEDKVDLIQLMKQDKIELLRTIYIVGVVQFLAIVSAVIGILSFMLNK
ncbi:MAG TPA: hypothetical protein VD996_16100 [Chitinophagaceae bacterium]|nr:hypothetical protein [Chitinophagaceae bacterium]